jgi:hypothetical protein
MKIGGGVDYRINHRLSLRPLQVDYLMTRFPEGTASTQTQNNLRASTGIVMHFSKTERTNAVAIGMRSAMPFYGIGRPVQAGGCA